ncbi:MAG: hypothetical protein MUC81_02820 [Bacteroidia bacterium]|nr:hypothetical protein [Bacteroidia bacterium]
MLSKNNAIKQLGQELTALKTHLTQQFFNLLYAIQFLYSKNVVQKKVGAINELKSVLYFLKWSCARGVSIPKNSTI